MTFATGRSSLPLAPRARPTRGESTGGERDDGRAGHPARGPRGAAERRAHAGRGDPARRAQQGGAQVRLRRASGLRRLHDWRSDDLLREVDALIDGGMLRSTGGRFPKLALTAARPPSRPGVRRLRLARLRDPGAARRIRGLGRRLRATTWSTRWTSPCSSASSASTGALPGASPTSAAEPGEPPPGCAAPASRATIDGVDLTPEMLDRARDRGAHDTFARPTCARPGSPAAPMTW